MMHGDDHNHEHEHNDHLPTREDDDLLLTEG